MIEEYKVLRTRDGDTIDPAWVGHGYHFHIRTHINVTNDKGHVEKRDCKVILYLSDNEIEELKALMEEDKKRNLEMYKIE